MDEEIKELVKLLNELLNSEPRKIKELICKEYNTKNGVYAIYEKDNLNIPIYIGKTEKQKKGVNGRMNNLLGDCLSHTLNLKLLCDKFLKWDRKKILRKDIITKWNNLPKEESKKCRREVREYIENNLRVRFKELDKEISRFEHFAIGVINPELND
ncbi:MAG: hypothetical protein KKF67_03320 [Nanoarchaeota archaeon]|nr:hypothetical protein [Nanoarchaeota archaeon]